MEKVVFVNSYKQTFAGFGLKSFDDFFNYAGGKRINKNTKRDVQMLTFDTGSGRKVFFLKRFHKPHFKDILFAAGNSGRLCSQAECEWQNAKLLLERGIQTFETICYGHRTICGIERQSFLVTEELKSQPLSDFVAENWSNMSTSQKEKIITSVAQAIRRIHNAGISLPDLYLWHIFIGPADSGSNDYDFAFIDLSRMKHNVTNPNERIKNLGRLHHSMIDKYFNEPIRRLLIASYAGNDWPGSVDALTAKVEKYSAKVSSKRSPKPY
ncbi:MAG: lipopolysaccharide kinase InaA family protein [Planctomycetota bacterium]|jgi:hypothetical protein